MPDGSSFSPEVLTQVPMPIQGAEIMTSNGESILRESIQNQIAKPTDLFDTAPGVSYSEADREFLGFSFTPQKQAELINFNEEQASRWFQIAEEEVNTARQKGIPLGEIDHETWQQTKEHELDHYREASKRGVDVSKSTLGIAFGYNGPMEETPRTIGFEWHVLPDETEYQKLNPVDRAALWMAPKEPSYGDCIRTLNEIKSNRESFFKRPKEAMILISKLLKTTHMGTVEFLKYVKGGS